MNNREIWIMVFEIGLFVISYMLSLCMIAIINRAPIIKYIGDERSYFGMLLGISFILRLGNELLVCKSDELNMAYRNSLMGLDMIVGYIIFVKPIFWILSRLVHHSDIAS